MKDKLLEYGVLVGDERQQVRSYRNMVCLLVKNTNKGVGLSKCCVYVGEEHQHGRGFLRLTTPTRAREQ